MKKILLILTCVLAAACILATPFLCSHSNMKPERATEYYALKAQEEAAADNSPEAELMRLLLGASATPAVEATPSAPEFNDFGLLLAMGIAFSAVSLLMSSRKHPELFPALLWTAALAVPMGLLGSRLMYCLVNLPFYVKDIAAPEAMLKVWEGGLSLAGALPCVALAGVFGAKLGKVPVGKVLDELAIALVFTVICAALAADSIGMLYGPEMGSRRLPTAKILAPSVVLVLCGALLFLLRAAKQGKTIPDGHSFALMAFLYGVVMILIESLRRDGHMVWGFVHAEMLLDLAMALPALLWLAKTKKRILLSLLASCVMAGAVIILEFALDRSAIGDGLLYIVYAAVLAAYAAMGCFWSKKRLAEN